MEKIWLICGNTGSEDMDIKREPLESDADYDVSSSSSEYIFSSMFGLQLLKYCSIYDANMFFFFRSTMKLLLKVRQLMIVKEHYQTQRREVVIGMMKRL